MPRTLIILYIILLSAFGSVKAQENTAVLKRDPAFAGTFYPAGKAELSSRLQQLFKEAAKVIPPGNSVSREEKIQTIIVPHAGYDYSGMVAATGYLQIPKNASYENIFIITTSHRQSFEGISVCQASSYNTPLGELKVNQQLAGTLIEQDANIFYRSEAHAREQGIEVQLPFIKYHLKSNPSIVPIVIGSSSLEAARSLATALLPWFNSENLFIISADFSRYPSQSEAKRIDKLSADAIKSGNPERFYTALRDASKQNVKGLATPSGDWSSIMSMLYMANRTENLNFSSLLYRNSGDSPLGDRSRVVGYWALAGHYKAHEDKPSELSREEKATLLRISRSTLESYIQNESIPEISSTGLSQALKRPATALVSLYMGERLRGRIEFITPAIPLTAMVQEMTIASATLDQRFAPVEASELEYIHIEISILSTMEKVENTDGIDLLKHGIYLVKNENTGLYLPGKAEKENWSLEELLGHCAREKAGLGWEDWKEAELYRFETIHISESDLNPSTVPAL